jgi:hypothetical protein
VNAPAIDPRAVFTNAERFMAGAMILSDSQKRPGGEELWIPTQVLLAFALELYLKCLLNINGCLIPGSHNVALLFANLPETTKAKITKRFKSETKNNQEFLQFVAKHPQFKNDLPSVLNDAATAFEDLRYIFEGKPKDMCGRLWWPTVAVRAAILEIHPAWVPST